MVGNVTPDFARLKIDFVDEFSNGEQEKEREDPPPPVESIFVLLFSIGR